jgi:dihydroorotate dehydrogenase (NAD+) catalytic subunit
MIELARGHKFGLPIENPVMLAGGTVGYGEAVPAGAHLKLLGAVVVGPFMRNSRPGMDPPRLAETNGGFVLDTGLQNRGVKAGRRKYGRLWPTLGCPVIAQIADSMPRMAGRVAEQLTSAEGLSGLELLLPQHATPDVVNELVRQVTYNSDLPVMVKLPSVGASSLAPVAVEAGASGLVVALSPAGVGYARGAGTEPVGINGSIHGPLVFPSTLAILEVVRALDLPCSLIACGGIHTLDQARQALSAGADAIQIGSAVWVEPSLPARLATRLVNG